MQYMATKENIHAGHRQRLRKTIDRNGVYEVDDLHFLEYLLTFVISRADTNKLAHTLLKTFGSIDAIFESDVDSLLQIDGVGIKTARFLKYMSVSAYVYNNAKIKEKQKIITIAQLIDYFNTIIPPSKDEQMVVVILNKNFTVKCFKIIKGNAHNLISVNPHEITDFLIQNKAVFCAIAHTHPNHSAFPSLDDITTFTSFNSTLKALAVTLLENVIIGDGDYYSLKNRMFYNLKNLDKVMSCEEENDENDFFDE